MLNSFQPVLTDFRPVEMVSPTPQAVALELSAWGFAKAACRQQGITDKEGFQKIHQEIREKFDKYALSPSAIKQRQLVFFPRLKDIRFENGEFHVNEPEHEYLHLFDNYEDLNPKDIRARHDSFAKIADDSLAALYGDEMQAPDDLVHVTGSGYLAPSPVERMVADKGWFTTTVTHSYHMGCYGAFPAMKMAHGFLCSSQFGTSRPKDRVDIVHTELLSAHTGIEGLKAENIITMTLFADSFIRYSVVSEDYLRARNLRGLRILTLNEHLIPNSSEEMTLGLSGVHFRLTLTVMVPVIIKQWIRPFVENLLQQIGIDFEREKRQLAFAIHPGGPKIVEHIQEMLGLADDQVAISKAVFASHGNMSSATVPHILKAIIEEDGIPVGTRVVALGFGPGLTISGQVLTKI